MAVDSSKPGDPSRTSKITLAKALNAGLRRALEAEAGAEASEKKS